MSLRVGRDTDGSGSDALRDLTDRIREEGDPLVPRFDGAAGEPLFGPLVVAGPANDRDPARYALVVESIREGYLCHYETSRLLEEPDPDLALLAGDLFYAIGLSELAVVGDLESTEILSDLIRVAADLRAADEHDRAERLWLVQVMAMACGKMRDHGERLEAVATGDEIAIQELFEWAASTAEDHGMSRTFHVVCKAIDSRRSNL